MSQLLAVGLGGFVGAVARYLVSGFVHRLLPLTHLPWGTLVVNAAGCLAIGALGALAEVRGLFAGTTRLLLFIGVLGGFTTFSSFAYETLALARDGETLPAAANVAQHLALCLGAVVAGDAGVRAHSRLHTAKVLRLSSDLPVVVEIVDTREKIEAFLPVIDAAIPEGLATLEKVEIRFYRSGRSQA